MIRGRHLKYGNKKVEYDGHKFDSQRERDRYIFLKEKEKEGIIRYLELQPEFELIPSQYEIEEISTKKGIKEKKVIIERALKYRADFSYVLSSKPGDLIIEDVKISPKLRPIEFKIKKKLMLYIHGIRVVEVYKPTQEIRYV